MAAQREGAQMGVQQGQQRLALLAQERDTLTSIIQQERARTQSMKEQFGLKRPLEKGAILHISRKLKAGQQLTGRELDIAKQHGDIFGAKLKTMGNQMAGPEWEEIKKNEGLGVREEKAQEQRVQVENTMKIQIDNNATAVADQLVAKLTPLILQAKAEEGNAINTAMAKFTNAMEAQREAVVR